MTLPPQAYTRDILIKAYEWLREQPPGLREKAKDADSMVALYMQSRRRITQDNWEQKVSEETFKNELRHLAEDLKQFEDPALPPQQMSQPSGSSSLPPMFNQPNQPMQPTQPLVTGTASQSLALDDRSLKLIREVQKRFNLSQEVEALRMLIVLGYEKARPLLDEITTAP